MMILRMLWILIGVVALALAPAAAENRAAPAKGTPRLNVYFTKGFDDAAWQRGAFDKVAKAWKASAPPAVGRKAVVIATITRDGKLLDAKVSTASGSEAWDLAALEAVRKAAPYPPLPKSWADSSVEAHFHFEFPAKG